VTLRTTATWIAYPVVLASALLIYAGLLHTGLACGIAGYIAVLIGAVAPIFLLERVLPYRDSWSPTVVEAKTDLTFLAIVNSALPLGLSILTATVALHFSRSWDGYWQHWWPRGLACWQQVAIVLLVADLPRYWLHRVFHERAALWPFHAVHHSVRKLNWLNVGRFHPVDTSLQFMCDSLPFIVLGVPDEVITTYFVLHATKAFLQHSNVDVKLGWLNYIISGPELHRWHHSVVIRESNTNYGNKLSIWDLLFGTFFYPAKSAVVTLGLADQQYPMTFGAQMKVPFAAHTGDLTASD
jgi:sterol desaturase/sphingolipid hydroxylase (fatty acid hydroxylase superfamily)